MGFGEPGAGRSRNMAGAAGPPAGATGLPEPGQAGFRSRGGAPQAGKRRQSGLMFASKNQNGICLGGKVSTDCWFTGMQELQYLEDEHHRAKVNLQSRIKDREDEIQKLRNQVRTALKSQKVFFKKNPDRFQPRK